MGFLAFCKGAGRNLLCSLLSVAILFSCTGLMGYVNLGEWHNIRLALYGVVLLFLTCSAMGTKGYRLVSRAVVLVLFPYMFLFLYANIQGMGTWKPDPEVMRAYFYTGYGLTVMTAFLAYGAQVLRRGRRLARGAACVLLLLAALVSLTFAGYYHLYHIPFAGRDMVPVLQTYWQEALEFVDDKVGWPVVILGLAGAVLYTGVAWQVLRRGFPGSGKNGGKAGRGRICTGGAALGISLACFSLYVPGVYPLSEYRWASDYISSIQEAQRDHEELTAHLTLTNGKENSLPAQVPGTVIFIIGESESRDHMKAFNPAYPVDTTPWLTRAASGGDFFLLRNGYANFNHTTFSLEMALTASDQYNHRPFASSYTLLDAARAAGYDTWWISNQSKEGNADSPQVLVSETAEHSLWTTQPMGEDGQVLDLLKRVPQRGNHFIVIHLGGSHGTYSHRLPKGFRAVSIPGQSETETDYDNTVYYTDQVLRDIFDYARDHMDLQVLVYASDHGEDMVYKHGGEMTWPMVRIPVFFYLSPRYQARYSGAAAMLASHGDSVFTNDLLFDTVCGLIHSETDQYDPAGDISSASYGLDWDKAVTMHGAVQVAEDPGLAGK